MLKSIPGQFFCQLSNNLPQNLGSNDQFEVCTQKQQHKLKMLIFKLADRMRSIRTTGASKNRDSSRVFFVHLSFLVSELFLGPMVFISTYGMYKYLWYV